MRALPMTKTLMLLTLSLVGMTGACAAAADSSENTGAVKSAARAGLCPPPTTPRLSAPAIPTDAVQAKIDLWNADLLVYEAAAADYNVEAADHAAAFAAAATGIVGRPCVAAAECDTGSAVFVGNCLPLYYGNAICAVTDTAPPAGPVPPPQPVFTCADFTCPGNYQCEVEIATRAITCLEPQLSCAPPPGGGGGGGGGGGEP